MEKLIKLFDYYTMRANFAKIMNDAYMFSRLWNPLLQQAGQEKVAAGVILPIAMQIQEFTNGTSPILQNIVMNSFPSIIKAMVENPDDVQLVLDLYQDMRATCA